MNRSIYFYVRSALLFIIISVIFISCKKEDVTHLKVSQEFRHWTVFEKGSYWIFKNDSTQAMDSVYIIQGPDSYETMPDQNVSREYVYTTYSSGILKTSEINVQEKSYEYFICKINNDIVFPLIAINGDFPSFMVQNPNTEYTYISRDTVYYVGSIRYVDVIHTRYKYQDIDYNFWLARDIGFIKILSSDSAFSWSLQRYQTK